MKTVKLIYPSIVIETKYVEVDDEKAEDLVENRNGVVDFIWDNIGEKEQMYTQGKTWIEGFVENCGCGIFLAPKSDYDCPKCGSKRNENISHGSYKCENCGCISYVEFKPPFHLSFVD